MRTPRQEYSCCGSLMKVFTVRWELNHVSQTPAVPLRVTGDWRCLYCKLVAGRPAVPLLHLWTYIRESKMTDRWTHREDAGREFSLAGNGCRWGCGWPLLDRIAASRASPQCAAGDYPDCSPSVRVQSARECEVCQVCRRTSNHHWQRGVVSSRRRL